MTEESKIAQVAAGAERAEEQRGGPKKSFFIRHRTGLLAAALLGIPILFWAVLSAFPLVFGIGLSFFEWTNLTESPVFIGFENFKSFFTNEYYWMSLVRTVFIGGLCFVFGTVCGLLLALAVNKLRFLRSFFRSVWYIPCVASTVAVSQIFQLLLDYDGILNSMLIGMGAEPVSWDLEYGWSVFWIVVYSTWKGLGGSVLMWLAALQSVDSTIVEAAELDGAGRTTMFFRIKLPQMMPIVVYILISGVVGAMQIYEQVQFITNGGPSGQTAVLAYRIMRLAFWDNNFGMASCCSVIMMLVTFVFVVILFRKQKEGA